MPHPRLIAIADQTGYRAVYVMQRADNAPAILDTHWQDPARVEQLIAMGDIYWLNGEMAGPAYIFGDDARRYPSFDALINALDDAHIAREISIFDVQERTGDIVEERLNDIDPYQPNRVIVADPAHKPVGRWRHLCTAACLLTRQFNAHLDRHYLLAA